MTEHIKEHEKHPSPKEYWEAQQPIFDQIYSEGMENYVKTIPELEKSFKLKDRDLRCIDERTPGGIHLAGSGILMSDKKLEKTLFNADIKNVWTHEECGAAKLYAQKNGFNQEKSDEYARAWGETLEKKFGIKYRGHIKSAELQGPGGLHIARLAYYDATGQFDFQNVKELPPGFIISRKYLEADYAKAEMKVAISIAMGAHGFNDLINKKTPFIIVPIADGRDNKLSLKQLKNELKTIAQNNPAVIIDGFTF